MSLSIEAFAPEHLDAVARFSERYWARPQAAAFLRWRYVDALPYGRMFLALHNGECVAVVSALRKHYLVNNVRTQCLEVFDWHCLPEFRASGAGLRVMRAMMRQPEPLLSIGGTSDVLSVLPKMGWVRIGDARVYELPSSGLPLAAWLHRRTAIPVSLSRRPLDLVARAWFRPRQRTTSADRRLVPVPAIGDAVVGLYRGETGYGFVQEPQPDLLAWTAGARIGNGSYLNLCFTDGGSLRAWVMARVYERDGGLEAALLEVFAPQPDVATYAWIVREASAVLVGFGPHLIRARATCPVLQAALRANRFVEKPEVVPLHFWGKGTWAPPEPLHITLNHTDEPLRPYPAGDSPAEFLADLRSEP